MVATSLKPWANAMRFDQSSTMRDHCYADRFSVVRVETSGPLPDAIHKSSTVPALLLSTFVRPVSASRYRLWVEGKSVPTGGIHAFRTNVVDLAAQPAMWADSGVDCVHFHVRRASIDDTAADFGYAQAGGFRLAVADDDLVLAQITKSVLPSLAPGRAPHPLALDNLELILCAHLLQRHGAARLRTVVNGGLAVWQQKRALELLRENLEGRLRLLDLARECDLSVSHFARAFKTSFGTTVHRWLTQWRIDRAKELLARTNAPLADVAIQSGFGDQAAFSRTFRRVVGTTPGAWRREHARPLRRDGPHGCR
jgi:AraC family transcriptional regulator